MQTGSMDSFQRSLAIHNLPFSARLALVLQAWPTDHAGQFMAHLLVSEVWAFEPRQTPRTPFRLKRLWRRLGSTELSLGLVEEHT